MNFDMLITLVLLITSVIPQWKKDNLVEEKRARLKKAPILVHKRFMFTTQNNWPNGAVIVYSICLFTKFSRL